MELIILLIFAAVFSFALVYVIYYFNRRLEETRKAILRLSGNFDDIFLGASNDIIKLQRRVKQLERGQYADKVYYHRHDDIFRKANENFKKDPPSWGPNDVICGKSQE